MWSTRARLEHTRKGPGLLGPIASVRLGVPGVCGIRCGHLWNRDSHGAWVRRAHPMWHRSWSRLGRGSGIRLATYGTSPDGDVHHGDT
jgi:hypothetical protein